MKKIKIAFILICLLSVEAYCQSGNTVEMADILRQDGKIYTVVLGLVVIFAGMIIFLVRLDKKIFRLEKELKTKRT